MILGDGDLEVLSVKVRNKRTYSEMDIGSSSQDAVLDSAEQVEMALYVKEMFGISNAAYHELSMIYPSLPRSTHLKKESKAAHHKVADFPYT